MNSHRISHIEWPTVALIAAVYGILICLVWFHAALPWWVILPVGAYVACLHSSLQHEVLHGHPTRNRTVNELMVFVTPHLWLPYGRYRDLHLKHHNNEHLTCPVEDPESYYLLPGDWNKMPGIKRAIYTFNNTLFGRMLIGPAVGIIRFWTDEFMQMVGGRTDIVKCWGGFFVSTSFIMAFLSWAGMPIWQYILLVAYPAISLALVRSYCEHQAAETVGERTIIVEASWIWSLLYLNNNLHIAHHEKPRIAWYQLPSYYTKERENFLEKNNYYLKRGYKQIFHEYLFKTKESVQHPNTSWLKSGQFHPNNSGEC
jgi:fatty acid desaturase